MRYESARLSGFSVSGAKKRRRGFDTSFFIVVLLLLGMGLVMVLNLRVIH